MKTSLSLFLSASVAFSVGCNRNVINLGNGGATATVSGQTSTNATSTGAVPTTTSVTTGGSSACANDCTIAAQVASQLGCMPSPMCAMNCTKLYQMFPQCSSQADALYACGMNQIDSTHCQCNAMGATLTCNVCPSETQAFTQCISGMMTSSATGMTAGAGGG